jgi:Ca-activated chloride channel homolog
MTNQKFKKNINRFCLLVLLILGGMSIASRAISQLNPASEEKKRPQVIRVDVDLVVVKVTVTDPLNRYVTGLSPEHFSLYEDRVEQKITHFTQENAPVSLGVIFDSSGSMKEHIGSAKNSVMRFLQNGNKQDEFFMVAFNHQTALMQDFTRDATNVQNQVAFRSAGGRTALYDAVYLGLEKMNQATHEKKALIVITDGEDNSSRYSFSEVRDFSKELDVQIYAIGERGKLGYGTSIIQDLVSITGGRSFFPMSFSELDYYCDLIHAELRKQYILGFSSTNKIRDGKWRKLKVKLNPPEGLPKLMVRAKEGYYAPKS